MTDCYIQAFRLGTGYSKKHTRSPPFQKKVHKTSHLEKVACKQVNAKTYSETKRKLVPQNWNGVLLAELRWGSGGEWTLRLGGWGTSHLLENRDSQTQGRDVSEQAKPNSDRLNKTTSGEEQAETICLYIKMVTTEVNILLQKSTV